MKVYQIIQDPDRYRSLLVKNDRWYEGKRRYRLLMDGSKKKALWEKPLETVIDGKRLPEPDILDFGCGYMALHKRSLDLLGSAVKGYAELLPVFWKGGTAFVVNVIGLVDCLDEKATTWGCDDETGELLYIERHAFKPSKIPRGRMFKIPQHPYQLFCLDAGSDRNGFHAAVKKHRLSGVIFKEVWSR